MKFIPRRLSIRSKLSLILALVVLLSSLSVLFSSLAYREINWLMRKISDYSDIHVRAKMGKDLQLHVTRAWQYATDAALVKNEIRIDEDARQNTELAMKDIDDLVLLSGEDTEQIERLSTLKDKLPVLQKTGEKMYAAYLSGTVQGDAVMYEFDQIAEGVLQEAAVLISAMEGQERRAVDELFERITRAVLVTAVSAGVLVLSAAGIIILVVNLKKSIIKPISEIEQRTEEIALGDLTIKIELPGHDEIASLGRSINKMAFNLKDMLAKITQMSGSLSVATTTAEASSMSISLSTDAQKKAIEQTFGETQALNDSIARVAAGADELSGSSAQISSSIFEMSASIGKMAENAVTFDEAAHNTASSVEQMLASIAQIASSLDHLSESSEKISSSIHEVNAATSGIEQRATESVGLAEAVMSISTGKGLKAAGSAMEGMKSIKQSVQSIAEVIRLLGARTEDIGKLTDVIIDVAEQTNLLAINASILAAQAGEHGRGFGVVANEIKNLSKRTASSTNVIIDLVKSIRDATASSANMAADGVRNVENGILLVQDVTSTLGEIAQRSKASTDMVDAIQRSTAEEAGAIKQISAAIGSVRNQIENIAGALQEQGKGSKFILSATESVKNLSEQLGTATKEQDAASRQIARATDSVSTQAAQIAKSVGMQKENSDEIVGSMKNIRSATSTLIGSSAEMDAVVGTLKQEARRLLEELQKFKV